MAGKEIEVLFVNIHCVYATSIRVEKGERGYVSVNSKRYHLPGKFF